MDESSRIRAAWLARHVLPHEEMLRRWLSARPLGGLEIDDVIQETYAVLAELASVDEIRNPRSYVFQVAHSVVHAQFRRSRIVDFRSFADSDALGLMSDTPSPEKQAADKEFLRIVESYMETLPENCREVIILRRVHQLSHREIAVRLGIAEASIEKLLFKATHMLMNTFGRGVNRTRQDSIGRETAKANHRELLRSKE
jgi:RNA polymerase sigma factor (sigma-70 family)